MSRSYPIISITGSSGAGTTSVKKTFENIFRREKVAAAYVEGDAFHRYNRIEMRTKMAEKAEHGAAQVGVFERLEPVEDGLEQNGRDEAEHEHERPQRLRHLIDDAREPVARRRQRDESEEGETDREVREDRASADRGTGV